MALISSHIAFPLQNLHTFFSDEKCDSMYDVILVYDECIQYLLFLLIKTGLKKDEKASEILSHSSGRLKDFKGLQSFPPFTFTLSLKRNPMLTKIIILCVASASFLYSVMYALISYYYHRNQERATSLPGENQ